MLAIAAQRDWEIKQIDVKTAFLYGNLNEEVYIKWPDDFIYRLNKAIYGPKQAGRA